MLLPPLANEANMPPKVSSRLKVVLLFALVTIVLQCALLLFCCLVVRAFAWLTTLESAEGSVFQQASDQLVESVS
jgi:hypothetical protein